MTRKTASVEPEIRTVKNAAETDRGPQRRDATDMPALFYRYRAVLILPPLLFSLFFIRFETERDWLLWPLGVGLFAIGVILRFWAQEHLHYRIRTPMKFTRSGPYEVIRNPIYIGNGLICLGLTVTSELLWMVPVMLLWCSVLYIFVVRHEERTLTLRYGEPYRNYVRDVPRWLPRSLIFQPLELINCYAWPSARSEAHNLLLLLPFILKELLTR